MDIIQFARRASGVNGLNATQSQASTAKCFDRASATAHLVATRAIPTVAATIWRSAKRAKASHCANGRSGRSQRRLARSRAALEPSQRIASATKNDSIRKKTFKHAPKITLTRDVPDHSPSRVPAQLTLVLRQNANIRLGRHGAVAAPLVEAEKQHEHATASALKMCPKVSA